MSKNANHALRLLGKVTYQFVAADPKRVHVQHRGSCYQGTIFRSKYVNKVYCGCALSLGRASYIQSEVMWVE